MSDLFKRIKEPFKQLKKCIRKKTRAHKLVVPGLGITVLIIVAGWLHLRKDTEDMVYFKIVPLDNIVKKRMWKQYLDKDGTLTSVFRKTHNLRLDWSGVKCISDESSCIKHDENVHSLKYLRDEILHNCENKIDDITHKVIYTNKSSIEQVQKIERVSRLSESMKFSMSYGIFHTLMSGLSIGLPNETFKASMNTSDGMNLKSGFGKSKKGIQTKLKANNIRIPKHSTITVSTCKKPNEERYTCDTWVTFQGEVTGTFSNIMRQKVNTIKIPMDKTLSEDIPTNMIDKESDFLKVKSVDIFEVQYELEETTVLEEEPKDC